MGTPPGILPPWDLIWMCCKPGLNLPMEAITRLLAAASARQFGGLTAVVIVQGPGLLQTMWNKGTFSTPTSMPSPIDGKTFGVNSFYRIFVVNPATPNVLPAWLTNQFDRIVYVTDTLPTLPPSALTSHLKSNAVSPTDPSQTYFSSFIPSILLSGPPPATPRADLPPLRSLLKAVFLDGFALVPDSIRQLLGVPKTHDSFRSERLDDDFRLTPGGITAKPRSPLKRDSCRIRLDVPAIANLWNDAQSTGTVDTFHDTVFTKLLAGLTKRGKMDHTSLTPWTGAVSVHPSS